MGRQRIPFTQAAVARLVKGVTQAGQHVAAVKVEPE
jgi:hypothetical protein